MPDMSPAPRTPMEASSPTGITARGKFVRSLTRKETARRSATIGKGAWCSMWTGTGTRCGPPIMWTGTRYWSVPVTGNVKKAVAGGFCYTYEYRPDGKLMRKSSSGRTLISCTYQADKKLKSLTDVSGRTVYYSYDNLGRLERIWDEEGTEIVRYSHTAGGKLKEIRHGLKCINSSFKVCE